MEENKDTVKKYTLDNAGIIKGRKKRQRNLIKNVCYEYAQNTSLQGIPYITKRGITLIEKRFWLITFVASLGMCSYLIRDVWIKWQTSPVIVTVSEHLVPVTKVPLPSITICPQAKCMSTVYNYTKFMRRTFITRGDFNFNITKEEWEKYEAISLICGDHKHSLLTAQLKFFMFTPYYDSTTMKYINEVALDYTDIFKACKISNTTVNCRKLFFKVVTAEGICYTMNSLAADEIFRMENIQSNFSYLSSKKPSKGWSMDHGYDDDSILTSNFYPDRGLAINGYPNVEILFGQILDDHDKFCFGYSTGLNLHIQHPADLPQASLYSYPVMNDHISLLALSFSLVNTSETLRGYNPDIRRCYFPEDRVLKYFKIYTAKNCKIECLSIYTYETCGCVEFYMPHNESDKICTLNHRGCVEDASVKLAYRESDDAAELRCNCLPACNSVSYDAILLRNDHNFEEAMKITGHYRSFRTNFTKTKFSRLKIIYKNPRFLSMRRSELFGMTDFLANCGGLLGLFLGFSFLSLVEIIYFSTLRMFCALRQDRKEEETLVKEEQGLSERF